jgi:hypothetical protein
MARKKHKGIPLWFPFALAASAVGAVLAGARAGWRLSGDTKPASTKPPLQTGGVLQDWATGDYRI